MLLGDIWKGKRAMRSLYNEYVIFRIDGGTQVQGFCFVLQPESDPVAFDALAYYAKLTPNKQLAADLRRELQDIVDRENDVDEGLAAAYGDVRQ